MYTPEGKVRKFPGARCPRTGVMRIFQVGRKSKSTIVRNNKLLLINCLLHASNYFKLFTYNS